MLVAIGMLFIIGGLGWFLFSAIAFRRMSYPYRPATTWELFGEPALGLVASGIGIGMLVWC